MRLIPPIPGIRTDSAAERRLHRAMSNLDMPGWTALHSLSLADHHEKRWGEIDFVIIGPTGVLAVEVKGGRVARTDGIWETVDRKGVPHRLIESPFKQAETALVALRSWIKDQLPSQAARRVSCGYGVAFPDVRFTEASPEWTVEMVGDQRAWANAHAAEQWLRHLGTHWEGRNRVHDAMDPTLCAELVRLLRADFELVPSLATRARGVIAASNRFTDEQLWLVEAAERNDRLLIEGGAGTGKTFLAAELARRKLADDVSIVRLVVPRSNAKLPYRGVLPAAVEVATIEEAAGRQPAAFLIADEAQDLLSEQGLLQLDASVQGGLAAGSWAFFLDPNAQARLRGEFDPEAYAVLLGLNPWRFPLTRNLRNTYEIVQTVQQVTRADIGVPGGGHGPDVRVELLSGPGEDFVGPCRRILRRLSGEQVRAGEVVVITWDDPDLIARELDGEPYRTGVFDESGRPLPDESVLIVTDPRSFQGLEAMHAILGPVPNPSDGHALAELYVSATRPRATLWLVSGAETVAAFASEARRLADRRVEVPG